MTLRTIWAVALGAALLTTWNGRAAAQRPEPVRGRVLAADGAPLAGAVVVEVGERARTDTDAAGAFALAVERLPARLVALRLGFAPETLTVAAPADPLVFRLRSAPLALDPLVVAGERSYSAASSGAVREVDVRLRPRESSQELLRLVPGLVIAQHGGGGKAEQIFLRGFDADHGTDVAIAVEGSPVNMVSHGHGQGYADLHFLMPEVVERIELRKGPYDVRDGDFATAGSVTFHTRDRLATPVAGVRYGSFDAARALAMTPFGGDADRAGGYLAASAATARGPFEVPQDHRRLTLFGKLTAPVSPGAELVAWASGFGAGWRQSGQVPERAVRSGLISRFGSIDPNEGGGTERYDLSVGLRSRGGGAERWELRAFAAHYDFRLFSNFTFYLRDPENGDGIEQTDRRTLGGVHAGYTRFAPLLGRSGRWTLGAGSRADRAHVTLSDQREQVRLDTRVDARIRQANLYSYAQRETELGERLRLQLGVRGDLFRFDVHDRLAGRGSGSELLRTSGVQWRGVVSPKANLAYRLTDATELYANAGAGFHSNDARDVVQSGHTDRVLPRAIGTELGARRTWSGGSLAMALWRLDLQSELVYVGDEGITEPNGATRRNGLDLEGRVRLAPWLWADADLNLARGRFRDLPRGEDHIPLAPTATATGGLTVRDVGPASGGVRVRFVDSRPANESASVMARGHQVWELFGAYALGGLRLYAAVDNLLDVEWNEAQFDTESRLRMEPVGLNELHFTPGAPRSLQLGVEYLF